MPSIIVHGGAGDYNPDEKQERGVTNAVAAGWEILSAGGSALDAVEAAIVVMEDDPIFRAGLGSALLEVGEPAEAESLLHRAYEVRLALRGPESQSVINTRSRLIEALDALGRHDEARAIGSGAGADDSGAAQ